MTTCPRCEGRKTSTGFITRTTGCGIETGIICALCDAAGVVSEETEKAYRLGRELSELRQSLDATMREVAALYGVTIGQWSNLEHGREALADVQAAFDWLKKTEQWRQNERPRTRTSVCL